MFEGSFDGLRESATRTGQHLATRRPLRQRHRAATGSIDLRHASLHNLRDVDISFPTGILTAVKGVAVSGKSSLVLGALAKACPDAQVVDQAIARGAPARPATAGRDLHRPRLPRPARDDLRDLSGEPIRRRGAWPRAAWAHHRPGAPDAPVVGLHLGDVQVLVGLLDRLVDGGSTVVVIEHTSTW